MNTIPLVFGRNLHQTKESRVLVGVMAPKKRPAAATETAKSPKTSKKEKAREKTETPEDTPGDSNMAASASPCEETQKDESTCEANSEKDKGKDAVVEEDEPETRKKAPKISSQQLLKAAAKKAAAKKKAQEKQKAKKKPAGRCF